MLANANIANANFADAYVANPSYLMWGQYRMLCAHKNQPFLLFSLLSLC